MTEDEKTKALKYLGDAISDTQSTIRAIDTKNNIGLAFLVVPLSKLGKMFVISLSLLQNAEHKFSVLSLLVLFCVCWFIAFWSSLVSIVAIDNPVEQIAGKKARGTFYQGGLFKLPWYHALINVGAQAKPNLETVKKEYPTKFEDIRSELVFEHLKLVYIRESKILRHRTAFRFLVLWLALGASIWLAYLAPH